MMWYDEPSDRLPSLRESIRYSGVLRCTLILVLALCAQPLMAQSHERWQYAVENEVEMAAVYSTEGKGVVLVVACVTGDLAIALAADVNIASIEIRWQVEGFAASEWLPWVRLAGNFYLPISMDEGKRQRSKLVAQGRAGNVISIQFRGSDRRLYYTLKGFTAATNQLSCV